MIVDSKAPYAQKTEWLNLLIYGPFGTGKTVLAATAQLCNETQNVFYADTEGGAKSIKDFDIDVDVFRINTFAKFSRLYDFAKNHARLRDLLETQDVASPEYMDTYNNLRRLEAWVHEIPDADALDKVKVPTLYRTIVVDSLTEVQKYCMYDILGIDINTATLTQENKQPEFKQWGINAEKMRLLVRAFRDIPMHTIFCCLDQTVKDEKDGSVTIKPSLPGKLADEACGFLDIVGYIHTREETSPEGKKYTRRVLQVQPAGKYNAKSRYQALGSYIEEPTIGKIVELINGRKRIILPGVELRIPKEPKTVAAPKEEAVVQKEPATVATAAVPTNVNGKQTAATVAAPLPMTKKS